MGVLLDETGTDLFGDAGREKRTLVEILLASADADDEDDENEENVAVVVEVVACGWGC